MTYQRGIRSLSFFAIVWLLGAGSALAQTTPRCTSSIDCPNGQYCTTEDGDCQSLCDPLTQVCPAVCAGSCRPFEVPCGEDFGTCGPHLYCCNPLMGICTPLDGVCIL